VADQSVALFNLGLKYDEIADILRQCDVNVSTRTIRRWLNSAGKYRCKHYYDVADVVKFITDQLNGSGALHGYRWMYYKCLQSGLRIQKEYVRVILTALSGRNACNRSRNLHRREYISRGPNFVWHVDSCDKLRPYGICINGAIDGFSRKMLWLNAYHTSSDPAVVCGYFTGTLRALDGCPRIVRADMSTENSRIRDGQRFLRRHGCDEFANEKSFLYGRSTSNQRIESWWAFLCKECVQFWMDTLNLLKESGHFSGYDCDKNLTQLCFMSLIQVRYVSVTYIQHRNGRNTN